MRPFVRALGSFLVVSALCLPATAQQLPPREAVVASLSGFESQPSVAEVRGWGPGVVPVLASILDDGDVMVGARARSAFALRVYLTDPAALAVLRRVAADAQANLFVRLAALDALAEHGHAPFGHRAARVARRRRAVRGCGGVVTVPGPDLGPRGAHRADARRARSLGASAIGPVPS